MFGGMGGFGGFGGMGGMGGLGGRGGGLNANTQGVILESLDPLSKTKKYVELLLPETSERVLMGEPGLINNSYMNNLWDFYTTDLEWFATFIGLNTLAEKDVELVQSQMLAHPKSVQSLCKWLHKTPFIGPQNLIPHGDDAEAKKKVQTQPAFYKSMETGAVSLLYQLCTGSKVTNIIEIACMSKHFQGTIDRLVVFLQPPTSTPKLARLSLAILQIFSQDPRTITALQANSSSVTNLRKIVSTVSASQKPLVEQLITQIGPIKEKPAAAKPAKACASCGATDVPLQKCSGCSKVRYCNREHQKQHWKEHKPNCKK